MNDLACETEATPEIPAGWKLAGDVKADIEAGCVINDTDVTIVYDWDNLGCAYPKSFGHHDIDGLVSTLFDLSMRAWVKDIERKWTTFVPMLESSRHVVTNYELVVEDSEYWDTNITTDLVDAMKEVLEVARQYEEAFARRRRVKS